MKDSYQYTPGKGFTDLLCGWCHQSISEGRCQNQQCRVFGMTIHEANKLADSLPAPENGGKDK